MSKPSKPAASTPLISIVLINKNDRDVLLTLKALSGIRRPKPYEIVVVDGSSGKLADIEKQFPDIAWINFKSKTDKHITIPEQRNVGVRASRGAVVAFIDANCIPDKDWLYRLTKPIMDREESIVAGAVFSVGGETLRDTNYNRKKHKKYIAESGSANMAFTRELYDDLGGFDETFDYGSDVDFSWRVAEKGYKLRYEPEAIIRHDWGDTKDEVKRSFRYGKARAKLYIKHPVRRKDLLHKHVTVVIYPLYILFLPVAIVFPEYLLILLIPLLKNYNNKPLQSVREHMVFGAGTLYETIRTVIRNTA